MDGDDGDDSDNYSELSVGEMVQLLLHALRQHGPESGDFQTFLDNFRKNHEYFEASVNDVFVCAVSRRGLELVKILLSKYPAIDVDHSNPDIAHGDSPLCGATRHCNEDMIRVLLEHGASVCTRTATGESSLELACEHGILEVVRQLVDRLDRLTDDQLTDGDRRLMYHQALMTAAYRGHHHVVKLLIDTGVDVNINVDDDLGTALHRACHGGSLACVDLLLRAGADIESHRRCLQQTPLMRAAEWGHVDVVRRLLAEGAQVNAQTDLCSTPLTLACHYAFVDLVKLLLEHGADVHVKNFWGFTPLFMGTDTPEILQILLDHGADVNEKCGDRGEAALHLASVIGCHRTVMTLLDRGAQINIRTDHNETALWLAVWKGHVNVCRLLLQRNCQIGVPSNGCQVYAHDYVELELAMGRGDVSIMKMLLLAGCPLINPLYFSDSDVGPMSEMPSVRLRKETFESLLASEHGKEGVRWLQDFVSSPRPLKHLCVLLIRNILGVPLEHKIRTLTQIHDVIDDVCFTHFLSNESISET